MNQNQFFQAINNNQFDLIKKNIYQFVHINFQNSEGDTPLSLSLKESKLEISHFLLENFADFNNFEVLKQCLNNGHFELLDRFLNNKVDIFQKDKDDTTLLMLASKNHLKKYVDYFVQKGLNINERNKKGYNSLDHCLLSFNDDDNFFQHLITLGAEVSTESSVKPSYFQSKGYYYNALSLAVANTNNLKIIQFLLDNYPFDLKEMKSKRQDILHLAFASNAHLEIIKYLVNYGVSIDATDGYLYNQLINNIKYYDKYEKKSLFEKMNFLVYSKVALDHTQIHDMQVYLIDNKEIDEKSKLKLVIDLVYFYQQFNYKISPIEIDYFLKENVHPRIFAYANKKSIGNVLIDKMKSEDYQSIDKLFSLKFKLEKEDEYYILETQNEEVVERYLKCEAASFNNNFILSLADNIHLSIEKQKQFIQICIDKKCNIHTTNEYLENVCFFVRTKELAQYFIDLGVDYNQLAKTNYSALYSCNINPELIDFWIKMGLDINHKDDENFTPLDNYLVYAEDGTEINLEIIEAFFQHGAILNTNVLNSISPDEKVGKHIVDLYKAISEKKELEASILSNSASLNTLKI